MSVRSEGFPFIIDADEERILREHTAREVRILREADLGGFYFNLTDDSGVTLGEIAGLLASHSVRSGAWRCSVVRDDATHRPTALKFVELPS